MWDARIGKVEWVDIPNGLAWCPDGTTMYYADTPTLRIELGGHDLQDVFITTAWELLSVEEHAAQPLSGSPFPHPRRGAGAGVLFAG